MKKPVQALFSCLVLVVPVIWLIPGCQQAIDTIRVDHWIVTQQQTEAVRQIIVSPALIAVADESQWRGAAGDIVWCESFSSKWPRLAQWLDGQPWPRLNHEYVAGAGGPEWFVRFEHNGQVIHHIWLSQVDVPMLHELMQMIDEKLPGEYRTGYVEEMDRMKTFRQSHNPIFHSQEQLGQ